MESFTNDSTSGRATYCPGKIGGSGTPLILIYLFVDWNATDQRSTGKNHRSHRSNARHLDPSFHRDLDSYRSMEVIAVLDDLPVQNGGFYMAMWLCEIARGQIAVYFYI